MSTQQPLTPGFGSKNRQLQIRITGTACNTLPSSPPITYRHPALDGSPTWDPTTDTITLPSHGLSSGDKIQARNVTVGGVLPSGLAENAIVYALVLTADTLQVAATLAGPPIDFATAGTGITSLHRIAMLTTTISDGTNGSPAAPTPGVATLLHTFDELENPRHGEYTAWTAVVTGYCESSRTPVLVSQG